MKSFIALVLLFSSASASAMFTGGHYSKTDKIEIYEAIRKACGTPRDLTLLETTEYIENIDAGVTNIYYTSQFSMNVRIDNGVFDQYIATVKSAVYSAYDHETFTWGLFDVLEVKCVML